MSFGQSQAVAHFANSAGCKLTEPKLIHDRDPFMSFAIKGVINNRTIKAMYKMPEKESKYCRLTSIRMFPSQQNRLSKPIACRNALPQLNEVGVTYFVARTAYTKPTANQEEEVQEYYYLICPQGRVAYTSIVHNLRN